MGLADSIEVWEYEKREQLSIVAHDLTKPERDILETLSIYSILTAEQITRMLYSPASHAYAQKHLRTLVKKGYLTQILPPKQTRFGSTPFVYILTSLSRNYLSSIGLGIAPRFRPSEERKRRGGPLLHSLAVNEVLLNAHLLMRENPEIELLDFVTEREFSRDPLRVEVPGDEKTVSLSPDLWLHMRKEKLHYCICVEVNLTPVEQKRWRQKVRTYCSCLPSYKARFGIEAMQVAVMVASPIDFPIRRTDGALSGEEVRQKQEDERQRNKRLRDLLHWTESELISLNAVDDADLFLLRTLSTDTLNPVELFLQASFRMPGQHDPVPLIPPEEEAESE